MAAFCCAACQKGPRTRPHAARRARFRANNLTACSGYEKTMPHRNRAIGGIESIECARCRTVAYCSAACKTADWRAQCNVQGGRRREVCGDESTSRHEAHTRTAEAGHAAAQLNLGNSYINGVGIPSNARAASVREAIDWYTRAAEAGNACAQLNLGVCYAKGTGVAADARAAVAWYTRAAQCQLGMSYYEGTGVAANASTA